MDDLYIKILVDYTFSFYKKLLRFEWAREYNGFYGFCKDLNHESLNEAIDSVIPYHNEQFFGG